MRSTPRQVDRLFIRIYLLIIHLEISIQNISLVLSCEPHPKSKPKATDNCIKITVHKVNNPCTREYKHRCFLSTLVLHFLALVSCPTWSRHICNLSTVAMLSLLGSDGLWDYVQIVMSNIFGSSPFIFVFLSNSCILSVDFYYFGQVVDSNSKRECYAWLWVQPPDV